MLLRPMAGVEGTAGVAGSEEPRSRPSRRPDVSCRVRPWRSRTVPNEAERPSGRRGGWRVGVLAKLTLRSFGVAALALAAMAEAWPCRGTPVNCLVLARGLTHAISLAISPGWSWPKGVQLPPYGVPPPAALVAAVAATSRANSRSGRPRPCSPPPAPRLPVPPEPRLPVPPAPRLPVPPAATPPPPPPSEAPIWARGVGTPSRTSLSLHVERRATSFAARTPTSGEGEAERSRSVRGSASGLRMEGGSRLVDPMRRRRKACSNHGSIVDAASASESPSPSSPWPTPSLASTIARRWCCCCAIARSCCTTKTITSAARGGGRSRRD